MTNKDKIIAAFLVSLGALSISQADNFVSNISQADKTALISTIDIAGEACVPVGSCDEVKLPA
ncbi:MAG: hypothetical protein A2X32_00650 [Elusimicrobia bacterium GWC2_64_44]|nr:MAG: hypothetical protein A2X32_00650 [Elusimicrobia bacterium GWC2_64_44]